MNLAIMAFSLCRCCRELSELSELRADDDSNILEMRENI